jgi:peroxiredoxin
MAETRILLKKSGIQDKLPSAADAEFGELFINYHSGNPMLCFKDNAGEIVEIKPNRSIDGGGGETPPDTGNEIGDTLWDGTHFRVWDGTSWVAVGPNDLAYVQKVDGGTITNSAGSDVDIPYAHITYAGLINEAPQGGKQYARVNGAWSEVDIPPSTHVGDTAPDGPTTGQLWFDTDNGQLLVWDGTNWVPTTDTEVPTSGDFGYWTRSGTTLSPVNSGDNLDNIGDAVFAGAVTAGGVAASGDVSAAGKLNAGELGAATGWSVVDSVGGVQSIRPSGSTNYVFQGGTTDATSKISLNADGSATFAGGIYPNGVDSSQGITSRNGFYSRVIADNAAVFLGYEYNTNNVTTTILENGSATFAGDITTDKSIYLGKRADGLYGATIASNGNMDLYHRGPIVNSTDSKNFIRFLHKQSSTDPTWQTAVIRATTTNGGINLGKLEFLLGNKTTAAQYKALVLDIDGSAKFAEDNIKLNADGSASFAGKVTSAATEASDTDTTLATKGYVDTTVRSIDPMRETFQELLVAVQSATNFGELKSAMLVALEDYAV